MLYTVHNFKKMESRIKFIESLELDLDSIQAKKSLQTAYGKKPVDGKDEAFVNTGSLVSFTDKLSGEDKEDVLNSTMLAQLHANKVANRYTDTIGWYKAYFDVMEKIGWIVLSSFTFRQFKSKSASFKISEVCLELIKALVGDDAAVLKDVVEMFTALSKNEGGLTLFDTHSFSSNKGGNLSLIHI